LNILSFLLGSVCGWLSATITASSGQGYHRLNKGFIGLLKSGSGEINCRFLSIYIKNIDLRELIHHGFHESTDLIQGFAY